MDVNELTRQEKKSGILYGLVIGLLTIVFSVFSIYYTKSAGSFTSLFVVSTLVKILGSIVIPVGFVYLLKSKDGKFWTFSRALKSIYILLASSIIVSSLGLNLCQKVIVPRETLEASYQNLMNLKIEDMEAKGATDDEIDQQLVIIEQDRDFAFSPLSFQNVVPPMFISLLLNFIFALVLAFLFRSHIKKKSE